MRVRDTLEGQVVNPSPPSAMQIVEEETGDDYESLTKADLKGILAANGISLPSRASRDELIDAVRSI